MWLCQFKFSRGGRCRRSTRMACPENGVAIVPCCDALCFVRFATGDCGDQSRERRIEVVDRSFAFPEKAGLRKFRPTRSLRKLHLPQQGTRKWVCRTGYLPALRMTDRTLTSLQRLQGRGARQQCCFFETRQPCRPCFSAPFSGAYPRTCMVLQVDTVVHVHMTSCHGSRQRR